MKIIYRDTHDLSRDDLEALFLSVEWSSGHYPDKLREAMRHFETVYTAWDGETLAGLVCAMDDGVMTAYIHYLLVRPEYQHTGIGTHLVELMKDRYRDFLRVVLVAYDREIGFYQSRGFQRPDGYSPMFITELWT